VNEYEVKIYETVVHTTTVEANDEYEAYTKAYETIMNGPDNGYDTEAEGFTGMYDVTKL